jgi:UDPglucose 6-dehydrogenase
MREFVPLIIDDGAADSDDIRDAPALDVARILQAEGASGRVLDPQAMPNASRAYPHLEYSASVMEASDEAA